MNLIDETLNQIFSVSPLRTRQRKYLFLVGASTVWLLMALIAHPPLAASNFVRGLSNFILNFIAMPFGGSGLERTLISGLKVIFYLYFLLGEILKGMFSADVLRHVVAIFVPFFLAYRIAIIYLNDIFEISSERIAFRYIRQAAFGINRERIVVENGTVSSHYKHSPALSIGGPGQVQVNLENVAVFDKIGGEAHIIGPTVNQPGLYVPLEAFERLRDVIDLRDQMTRSNEMVVESRTRDGIRISVRDVRLVFSVLRSKNATANLPYSFQPNAILNLAYNRTSPQWIGAMISLVRGQLQNFINQHTLGEILAAIGLPEIQEQRDTVIEIDQQATALFPGPKTDYLNQENIVEPVEKTPDFVPRLEITDLFYDPLQGFPVRASQRGVQLHWIDVGTWTVPTQVIPDMQMEAWQLTLDNEARRRELEELTNDSRLNELLRLIRDVPLITFRKSRDESKTANEVVADILFDYLGLIRSALDLYQREEQAPPRRLEVANQVISRYLQGYLKKTGQARYL